MANLVVVERAEAEAIYDSGREACVEFLMRLEARVARLEAGVSASSRNSSQPPSTDGPKTRQQRRQEARDKAKELAREAGQQRKAGAQDGHPGTGRELLPEDRMVEIVDHYPEECSECGREFTDGEKVPRHGPGRHQVAELPPTAVVYTEHRTHRLRCPGCARRTRAALGVVGESAFGPGLQAVVVGLTARNRVSRRDMSELLFELFGVRISVGAIDQVCQRASGLLAGPHERLTAQVLGSGAINVDETGWFLAGENRSMWTAATAQAAIFRIVTDRHRDRLQELLGPEFQGIVTSDRWWAYDLLDPEQRQACWSHLQRDFRFHSEGLAAQKLFGDAGLALTRRLFTAWHAFAEHHDRNRGFVSAEAFSLFLTIQYVAMVIIGGIGSILGALLGAVFVVLFPYAIEAAMKASALADRLSSLIFAVNYAAFGLVMILFLVFEPQGLVGIWRRVQNWFLLWPFKQRPLSR